MTEKDYYAVPAVSNSSMSTVNPEQGGTPLRYKTYVIDKGPGEADTPSMQNGKLVHLYVEDPTQFLVSDVERPTEKLAEWVEKVHSTFPAIAKSDIKDNEAMKIHALSFMEKYGNTKDPDKIWEKFLLGIDYYEFLCDSEGQICLTSSQRSVVEGCVESLKKNQLASKLLFEFTELFGGRAMNEEALYWEEEVQLFSTSIKLDCKALLDRITLDPISKTATLIDLKTTGKPIAVFGESFKFWRYYRQMGWYRRAIQVFLGDLYGEFEASEWTIDVYIVGVETHGLYETRVFKISESYLEKGEQEAMGLVERIAHATYYGSWNQCQEEKSTGYLMLEPDE